MKVRGGQKRHYGYKIFDAFVNVVDVPGSAAGDELDDTDRCFALSTLKILYTVPL